MTIRKRINQLTDAQFLHNDIAISAIINLCEKNIDWTSSCNLEHLLTNLTNSHLKKENAKFRLLHFRSELSIATDLHYLYLRINL